MTRSGRRAVVAAAVSLVALRGAWAQQPGRVWRIGLLLNEIPAQAVLALLAPPLAELGYAQGRDYTLQVRSAQGHSDRLDALARELLAAKVDLIVAPLNAEIAAARRASATVPIVMMFAVAPVETGLIASLARPGGNVTGTATNAPELAGKMIEVLRDAVPGLRRLALLAEPDFPGMNLYMQQSERAAAAIGLQARFHPVRTADELPEVLERLARDRPDAMLVSMTGPMVAGSAKVVAFAAAQRLPALYSTRGPVTQGGLMSYSADFAAMARRNAAMIDRIFKGGKPADIPVEEPARFLLIINLRAARALGLAIPRLLLQRADEVIE